MFELSAGVLGFDKGGVASKYTVLSAGIDPSDTAWLSEDAGASDEGGRTHESKSVGISEPAFTDPGNDRTL